MMEYTKEMIEKAKEAKTPEEIIVIAKENNTELSNEEAERLFSLMHKYDSQSAGELSDEELTNVFGGEESSCDESGDIPKYSVGDCVSFYDIGQCGKVNTEGVILGISSTKEGSMYKEWEYTIGSRFNPFWNRYDAIWNVYEHQIYGLK